MGGGGQGRIQVEAQLGVGGAGAQVGQVGGAHQGPYEGVHNGNREIDLIPVPVIDAGGELGALPLARLFQYK